MRRWLLALVVILPLFPARGNALTLRDVVELSKAGLGEDVLLALLEVDPSVFAIDTATLKTLKDAGVSQKVIIAMIRSGRTPPPPPQPVVVQDQVPPPEPQVIVIEHHDPQPNKEVLVPVPVYMPMWSNQMYYAVPVTRSSRSTSTRFIPTTGLSAPPPLPPIDPPVSRDSRGRVWPDASAQPRPPHPEKPR
jgi:hypothetical protein